MQSLLSSKGSKDKNEKGKERLKVDRTVKTRMRKIEVAIREYLKSKGTDDLILLLKEIKCSVGQKHMHQRQ